MKRIGANYMGDRRCQFTIWAPLKSELSVRLLSPENRIVPLIPLQDGYWETVIEGVSPGDRYLVRLDPEHDRPDPASHFQPAGVHGASEIVDHTRFRWEDGSWRGIPLSDMIQYEIHVGTFSPEGTFGAVIPRLGALREIGINAVELMPVAQFPGTRNWGYDGAYPFAVQDSYGGPDGLKRLVNECHKLGMSVILDVVYNHLGPEGNYLADYAPYFTDHYRSPWGDAINFDGPYSDGVKNYFIENALYWFREYHVDALRLDAIHGIFDRSASPFLLELSEAVRAFSALAGRKYYLIAESDLEDPRVIRPPELGGYGLDAQWCDDFHHAIHTLLTGEDRGYYADFGRMEPIAKSLREGFAFSGEYSRYRRRRHGDSSADRPAEQFVVFGQNHDQVGNRLQGDRLSVLVPFEGLKVAAGMVLLSPYVPLLFMGEEYAETAPFLYFVSHTDPGLIEAVRQGRKSEFRSFQWEGDPPDPQSAETFNRSRIDWDLRSKGNHRVLLDFYKTLIHLRRGLPALSHPDKNRLEVRDFEEKKLLYMKRWDGSETIHLLFNFGRSNSAPKGMEPSTTWKPLLDSADSRWNGPGTRLPAEMRGLSMAVFREDGPSPDRPPRPR